MPSSWASQRAPSSSLLVGRAHDELVAGNLADPRLAQVRSLVRESWRRSLAHHVAAEGAPPIDLDPDALEAYRLAHPLAGVMDMVRALLQPEADAGVVVAVGDAAGRLLWVEGDRGLRALTGEMGFVPGANWSEQAVGTSAPGTALVLDRSVQIHATEHFNRFVQPWSCTAAPVHDPETRSLVGVIDVTGGADAATRQTRLLVDATARAIEGELLISRLRARDRVPPRGRTTPVRAPRTTTLRVLGRDGALLEVTGEGRETVTVLSPRHAEILLMLAVHRQGLSAERLGELVYGGADAAGTLRPELVRLRRVLQRAAPHAIPASRPYRVPAAIHTDAHQLLSLLDRGLHRVALAAYRGPVLPHSIAPGVEDFRASIGAVLREALLADASVDVLLAYADTVDGADDAELLRLILRLLPARSPRRAGVVARLARLEAGDA